MQIPLVYLSHLCLVRHLSAALTHQGSFEMTLAATGTVNNFINQFQPLLIEQKHTNNMEKHFLFLMPPCRRFHLRAGYPRGHDRNRNDKHCAFTDGQLRCLLDRQMTRHGLESSFPSRFQCQVKIMKPSVPDFNYRLWRPKRSCHINDINGALHNNF